MSKDVYIVGIGMTRLGKFPDRSVKELTREAVDAALSDAGCTMGDVDAAWFSNTRQGMMEGQNVIRGQCALRSMGFNGIPIVNVENACASSSTGLREAYAHIKAGLSSIALVAGCDKMFYPDNTEAMFRAFIGGTDVHTLSDTRQRLAKIGGEPHAGANTGETIGVHSFFMDIYAAFARLHMRLFGTTQAQIAAVASKNHRHSTLNPLSQYRFDMDVEAVLQDKMVAWPLTRAMCAPISDGAAAIILCSSEALARFERGRAARVAAISLCSSSDRDVEDFDNHIGRRAALQAYEQAGISPTDIDVAEVHDACSFAEIVQVENLGLCERGAGGYVAERGETRLGGRIPVNTSGGLVSKGHPIGATGAIQLYELVTQLRGEAGNRQVSGARWAAAENGGGFWGVEEAATVVTILEGPKH
jgi:acetyl-CoA acyltransferase